MKKITLFVVMLLMGVFLLGLAIHHAEDLFIGKEDRVIDLSATLGFGLLGWYLLKQFGRGKAREAWLELYAGDIFQVSRVICSGDDTEVRIWHYPYYDKFCYVHFEKEELPKGGLREGSEYVWTHGQAVVVINAKDK